MYAAILWIDVGTALPDNAVPVTRDLQGTMTSNVGDVSENKTFGSFLGWVQEVFFQKINNFFFF